MKKRRLGVAASVIAATTLIGVGVGTLPSSAASSGTRGG